MRTLRIVASSVLGSGWCLAQTVWSMGAPWTDLPTVLAAAAPGDVVRLNGLQFAPFTLTKGLTILGPGTIRPASGPASQATWFAVPAGQRALVTGVDFLPLVTASSYALHRVDTDGIVAFEHCTFGEGWQFSLEVISGTTLLHHCTVAPTSPVLAVPHVMGGVIVTTGVCCIADSTLHGAPAHFATLLYSASPALMVSGGSVFVSGTTLRGGDGYHGVGGSAPGQSAVVAGGGALQIADCTLQAGSSPPSQPGAAALVGTANTLWARSTLTGGTGSTSGGGTSGPVQHVPQLVGMRISGSFRLGFATTLAAVAGSSLPLGMVGGFDPAPTTHPIVLGPVFGASVEPMPLLVAYPSAGATVTHVVNVPNVGQLLGVAVCAQAFQLDGALVRASAAVAGVVH